MSLEKRSLLLHADADDEDISRADSFHTPPCSSKEFAAKIASTSVSTPNYTNNNENAGFEDERTSDTSAVTANSGICTATTNEPEDEDVLLRNADDQIKRGENEKIRRPAVPYYKLYRYTTKSDKLLIVVGCLLAIVTGFCAPVTNYAFGLVTKAMIAKGSNTTCPSPSSGSSQAHTVSFSSPFMKSVETFVIYNCACGVLQFVLGYSMVVCFNLVAENQAHKIRLKYFESLLRQEIGWFDIHRKKDFSHRITEDILKIQEAMSEKLGLCIFTVTNFILLVAQSYYYGWKLSLLLTFALPPIFIITYLQTGWSNWITTKEQEASSSIATVAQEALTNIRMVAAFNGQDKEAECYDQKLRLATKLSSRKGAVLGLGHGLNWMCCFLNYSLAFWYGTHLVIESRESGDGTYGPDTIVVVFFGILVASYNIGSAAEYFEAFGVGTGSARRIFTTIDRVPKIDALGLDPGFTPAGRAKGDVEFVDVHFSYPSRPNFPVLRGFSLNIRPGQTVALVGRSGAGKSTCVQLLQRFYDISKGEIKLDGVDVRDLNPEWLRSQFGLVSQEPILFNLSIYENIKLGKDGATRMEVEEAAKTAFAHDFIMRLPEGYSTLAGERGVQLSGGQKQRIAIARALVRNPTVLLLDEATSALDMQSEAAVQAALERARHGRTTIIVAHRLSTIKAADTVIVLEEGAACEAGSHVELMEKKGLFYNLIMDQSTDDIVDSFKPELDVVPTEEGTNHVIKIQDEKSETVQILPSKSINDHELNERNELMRSFKLTRMLKMGIPEWPYLLAAAFFTILKGFNVPIYSIVFGNFIAIFVSSDDQYVSEHGNFYALLYLAIALVTGFSAFAQRYFAVLASDKFSLRLRSLLFKALLRQDISYFDEQENSVGRLCARLSSDASSMQGAIGNRLIGLVQAATIISLSLAMSFYYLPKMGAALCLFVPLAICATLVEGKILSVANITEKKAIENAVSIAVETLDNIRTVQSLWVQMQFMGLYKQSLEEAHRINIRRAHIRALAYAFVYALPYIAYSISIFYGAYLVEHECAHISDVFKVGEALIFGSMASGTALAYAPDYSKGKISAARIFKLLDRVPCIGSLGDDGRLLRDPKGKTEFQNVSFAYPLRPTVKALANVSLTVQPGDQIGLVGQTGSGKSTIAALLLHFYNPQSGKITFDDEDLNTLNTKDLRGHLALVAQEPVLFDRSIAENIAYGDNSRDCCMDEIIAAARVANIHDFIVSLPAGYSTRVGSLGSQLSGGQKQRVSIARALLRYPKLLILDEATSALDASNEKIVQEALEKAKDGRSSIVIAHRLTSIQNSTNIFVMNDGKIVEHGTHEQLLANCNEYHAMWYAQYRKKHKTQTQEARET